ncbi:hypothetical protein M378DRAFT_14168 [Amanita muscaria Koide BX008]|uniref:Uncharacterized protein n=1 Tax=Amanita muscaria (strain Koide BX008) TaxID=946122 RepID=A0A0C2WVP6_AMAMK|nr:hypothetical protein M378DRAFT_14168 [Amanita muscaria Koide BX008]
MTPRSRHLSPLVSMIISSRFPSLHSVLSDEDLESCIHFARSYEEAQSSVDKDATISPTFSFGSDAASSATSYTPDPHAVSEAEVQSYYAGLHSELTLLYRTGKEQWFPPRGPEAQRRLKELCEVFTHPIAKVWNHDLGWKVVEVMDAHTANVVRFKKVEVDEAPEDEEDAKGKEEGEGEEEGEAKKPVVGPVTIWIGVFPESTSATAAHDAAHDVLALLRSPTSTSTSASPSTRASPLTPALGLRISTKARPDAQGTMALYLTEGGGSGRLLGLSCRHVLIGSKEANVDYVHHLSGPPKHVLLLGGRAFTNLVDSIKLRIGRHGITIKRWRKQIERFEERETGTNAVDVEKAKVARIETQWLLDKAEKVIETLGVLLDQVNKDWNRLDNRVDWGIFQVNRAKLGTKLTSDEFMVKCFPRGDANREFEYLEDRLLSLMGTITDDLMRNPDMWGSDGEPCLLVVKSGNATGTTIGRANGIFSIVRDYFNDMSVNQTSMEWGIINYDSKSEVFSEPGDSGSAIADIHGTKTSDMTYATPFWWLLERIRANGFPNVHLNVVA